MPPTRRIAQVEQDVESWIRRSASTFDREFREPDGKVWVLKYISPRFLEPFLQTRELAVSATPGFTWGDGIYLTPLKYHYSTMMYGRVGVMGWIKPVDIQRVYDAGQTPGIDLYQQWIAHQQFLYRLLTTTVHADYANRFLRNMFRRRFRIDVTFFPPDQFNGAYVAPLRDRWLVMSASSLSAPYVPGSRPAFSPIVRECEWVVIVGEEFQESTSRIQYQDLLGPHLRTATVRPGPLGRPDLTARLWRCYRQNRARGNRAPAVILTRP